MGEIKTYRARERGYVDDRFIEDGEVFSTDKPKGKWMALLDKDGNELPDPEPEKKPLVDDDALEAVRRETTQKAQAVFDRMRAEFEGKLKAETSRADAAEKQFSDLKAEHDRLLSEWDVQVDQANARAEAAEKERDTLQAELAKPRATVAKK